MNYNKIIEIQCLVLATPDELDNFASVFINPVKITGLPMMLFATFEDLPVLPDLPSRLEPYSLQLALRIECFGFLHWFNSEKCTLPNTQKWLLNAYRASHYSLHEIGNSHSNAENRLKMIGWRLEQYYPRYQRWMQNEAPKIPKLAEHPAFKRHLFLSQPTEQLPLPKRARNAWRNYGIRSVQELTASMSYLKIMREGMITTDELSGFFNLLAENGCEHLLCVE